MFRSVSFVLWRNVANGSGHLTDTAKKALPHCIRNGYAHANTYNSANYASQHRQYVLCLVNWHGTQPVYRSASGGKRYRDKRLHIGYHLMLANLDVLGYPLGKQPERNNAAI